MTEVFLSDYFNDGNEFIFGQIHLRVGTDLSTPVVSMNNVEERCRWVREKPTEKSAQRSFSF